MCFATFFEKKTVKKRNKILIERDEQAFLIFQAERPFCRARNQVDFLTVATIQNAFFLHMQHNPHYVSVDVKGESKNGKFLYSVRQAAE